MDNLKFYIFNQNDSDGVFLANENVAEFVFIQAANANAANQKAKSLGICFGDRWSEASEEQRMTIPQIHFDRIEDYKPCRPMQDKPYCIIHYADGSKKMYYPNKASGQ